MSNTTRVSIELDLRDPIDRAALQAAMRTIESAEHMQNAVSARPLWESGKEVSKAAAMMEKAAGEKVGLTSKEKAKRAAEKRWERQRAAKEKKKQEAESRKKFDGETQEPLENYPIEDVPWPDGREIIEGTFDGEPPTQPQDE